MRAVRIERWGGPEVLRLVADAPTPKAGAGELLVRVTHAGVNFADTHQSANDYITKNALPFIPGAEVAGVVEADAHGWQAGERVIGLTAGGGGYAQFAAVPATRCARIPDGITDTAALALLLQGLTAWHVLVTAGRLAAGEAVVVTSGAGGTGSLLVQLARSLGAGRVIATASSAPKRQLAGDLGAHVTLDTGLAGGGAGGHGPLRDAVLAATGGQGADVVCELAGGAVFDQLFEALAPLGRLVVYGISSREQNSVRSGRLLKHSRAVVGLWLYHLLADPRHVGPPLAELFERYRRGELRVVEGPSYPLSEAARAHADLLARRTSGKLVLDPAR